MDDDCVAGMQLPQRVDDPAAREANRVAKGDGIFTRAFFQPTATRGV